MYARNFGSLAAVCLVALFLGAVNAKEAKSAVRMVNGEVIDIRKAPYIVQLRYNNQPFCGGTLVDTRFVVTAAHCFKFAGFTEITVVAGANTRTDNGVQRRIVDGAIYPTYSKDNMSGDVAVVKLESPMPTNTFIKTVSVCSAPVTPNQLMEVSGWGDMWHGQQTGSHELRRIRIGVMELSECQAKFRYHVPITKLMICAHPSNDNSCNGDSGGPAIYRGELCGIVSFGAKCVFGHPSMYTDVYAVKDFIAQTIKRMR